MPPVDRNNYEQMLAIVRTQLEEQAFRALWIQGRSTTLAQVLNLQGSVPTPASFPPGQSSLASTKAPTTPSSDKLTPRETEVLRLLAQGLTNPQIATQLVISLPIGGAGARIGQQETAFCSRDHHFNLSVVSR